MVSVNDELVAALCYSVSFGLVRATGDNKFYNGDKDSAWILEGTLLNCLTK